MKRKIAIISLILVFVAGVGIMSYPLLSAVINNISSRNNAYTYNDNVSKLDSVMVDEKFAEADAYNKSLTNNVILTDPFDADAYKKIGADYENTFKYDDDGLIGYIDIPKINVYLPIYHGTSEDVLAKGAGHLANTSIPVGGASTHSIISAHTGYPTETFFDYLTDLQDGDVFYIHVLNRTLEYQVDQIKVVLPEDTSDLRITQDEDYVTLLTCTPYGVNSHRLLVRGTRIPYTDKTADSTAVSTVSVEDGCIYFMGYKIPYWVMAVVIVCFVALVVFIVILAVKKSRKKSKHLTAKALTDSEQKKGGE